jgi:hypothetical protein
LEITIKEVELKQAIKEYVENTGIPLTGKEVSIVLKAGRGENKHTAHIEILPLAAKPEDTEDSDISEDQQAIQFDD